MGKKKNYFWIGIILLAIAALIMFFPNGLFSITGALEGGQTAKGAELSYVNLTLLNDTIIEPGESIKGKIVYTTGPVTDCPNYLLSLKAKNAVVGTYGGTLLRLEPSTQKTCVSQGQSVPYQAGIAGTTDQSLACQGVSGNFESVKPYHNYDNFDAFRDNANNPYTLYLSNFGYTGNICPNGTTGNLTTFSPEVKYWFVDNRCEDLINFTPVVQTFQAGSIINLQQFKVLGKKVVPKFFCYNNYILKYTPDGVEKSVLEYELIQSGGSVTVPQDEVWIVPYYLPANETGLTQTCSPDTITQAETGECTVDIALLIKCGGSVDFTTGTCITEGFNPCPPGQLTVLDYQGEKTCVGAPQVITDAEGNIFRCELGSILNFDTSSEYYYLCEFPSSISGVVCKPEFVYADGICRKKPAVECATPTKAWSQETRECVAIPSGNDPSTQELCVELGFIWTGTECTVPAPDTPANPKLACAQMGGIYSNGTCIISENSLQVLFARANIIPVIVVVIGLALVGFLIITTMWRR